MQRGWKASLAAAALALLSPGCGPSPGWDAEIEGPARPAELARQEAATQAQASGRGAAEAPATILFGDLHVHSSYSWDGYLFSLPLLGGEGAHPPADACDFARYCAALDFYALTDHAESLLPEHWEASKQSVRACNERAGDPDTPDLVAFTGFEWSQAGSTPEEHWGHRCVVFPDDAEEGLPTRPIASADTREQLRGARSLMRIGRWIQPWHWGRYQEGDAHLEALAGRALCPQGVPSPELPLDCMEVAETPAELHRKLDEWALPSLEIPHGTAWGIYTPVTTSIAKHLDPEHYDPQRMRLVELHSGHGSSEEYRAFRGVEVAADGSRHCPAPTPDFLPCCWQAGEIVRGRCADLPGEECERRVAEARRLAAQAWVRPGQVIPDARPEEWLDCGQCRDCFKPSFFLRPRETVQYAMSLEHPEARDAAGDPLRFRYGFVGSSDIHDARAGTGYKAVDRPLMTDSADAGPVLGMLMGMAGGSMEDPTRAVPPKTGRIGIQGNDMRSTSFLYPSGLAAVHARGRSRGAVWEALERRESYATSGPRILLWFDLLNAPEGRRPMGSEARTEAVPRFEVRAVGARRQQPGCPAWAEGGLSAERLQWLCRGHCHNPGEERLSIVRIEVVRIRTGSDDREAPELRIEDPWQSFECPAQGEGCSVQFEDPGYAAAPRDTVYYVRALQEPTPAINGAPLETRFDAEGNATAVTLCGSDPDDPDCLESVNERAWSSPIFVSPPRSGTLARTKR